MTPLEVLGDARYVLLTTIGADGRPAPTPVWVTRRGAQLQVWRFRETGTTNRIRGTTAVRVAPCSPSGRPRGASVDATAWMLPAADRGSLLDALVIKYGLRARYATWRAIRSGDPGWAAAVAFEPTHG